MRYPAIGGTRFRLFPSYAEGFAEPEVVEVSLPPGTVRAGPSDPTMCAVNPCARTRLTIHRTMSRRIVARFMRRRCRDRTDISIISRWRRNSFSPRTSTAPCAGPSTSGNTICAAASSGWTPMPTRSWSSSRSCVGRMRSQGLASWRRASSRTGWVGRSHSASITMSWRTKPGIRSCSPRSASPRSTRSACRFSRFTNCSPIWWH